MAVYVDDLMEWPRTKKWPFGLACHMIADTDEELLEFAAKLGLKTTWFQASPPHRIAHFDLTEGMRNKAIKMGALQSKDHEEAYWELFKKKAQQYKDHVAAEKRRKERQTKQRRRRNK